MRQRVASKNRRPRYERLKLLVNQPANATLADLGATPAEQDEAFGTFPDVARRYHELNQAEQRAREVFARAHAAAMAARIRWYERQRDEQVAALVAVIDGTLYDHVHQLYDLVKQAEGEQLTLVLPEFPPVPLRIGSSTQGGLEAVVGILRGLVKP